MNFAKNLIGGLIIMVFAGVIGIAQNAVRGNPFRLIPLNIATPAPSAATDATPAVADASAEAETPAGEVDASPEITAVELAAGELIMERVRIIMETGTAIIIDARGEGEFAEGHLPGALNIPTDNFYDYDVDGLVPIDASVIVYCRSVTCDLSDRLAQELRLMGYQNVVVYRGGWDEWSEAGFPLE